MASGLLMPVGESGRIVIEIDPLLKQTLYSVLKDKGLNLKELSKKIFTLKLPFIPCRSKSGGVHLYLFCKDWIPASVMKHKLEELSSTLGFGGCEVFPKQIQILAEEEM